MNNVCFCSKIPQNKILVQLNNIEGLDFFTCTIPGPVVGLDG